MNEDVLVYDIETRTYGKPDASKDNLRLFGCYSYKTNKYYLLKKKEDIQKIIDHHKYLVGFNTQGTKLEPGYDNYVLMREGITLQYKLIIDLRNIFKERASQMKIDEGMLGDLLMSYSLDFISRTIGIADDDTGKKKIDYKMFQKDTWTKDELKEIVEYTKRDVFVTKRMYEWVEKYFSGFRSFLDAEDVRKKKYLTYSTAGFAYRAICKAMKWAPDTGSIGLGMDDKIKGGYVSYPSGEYYEDDIYLLDFASLYPHIMIQCNLYGRMMKVTVEDRTWKGGGWKVEGTYDSSKLSGVCELFQRWYAQRVEFKEAGDKREYTIKIILNASYGIMDSPYYVRTYDNIGAGDCTRIGRQWAVYARKIFRENGYVIIYSDTDSVFIKDPFKNKKRMLEVKDLIIHNIKKTVPFPQETFDMDIDDEIKYIYFFKTDKKKEEKEEEMDEDDYKNRELGLMKKNYIYIRTDGKPIIKNLGIRKKSTSALTKKIFWDYLVPKIKKGTVKFKKTYLKNLIRKLLEKDLSLALMRREVGNVEQYAAKSATSLPSQIAKRYGQGIHFLIPNTKGIGVGKGKTYCTMEEFKENNLRIDHINLDNVWKELGYFIKPIVTKSVFEYS